MFEVLKNAWKIKDLRKKLLYTAFMLLIFRLCCFIPTPFIDQVAVSESMNANGTWGVIDLITGGAMQNYTIMAMGISPYINASIILQLLAVVFPKLGELSKEGPEGRKKVNQYTRLLGVGLAFVQAIGICLSIKGAIVSDYQDIAWLAYIIVGITITAGIKGILLPLLFFFYLHKLGKKQPIGDTNGN